MYNPDWNLFLLPQYQHVQYQLLFLRECCWQRRLFGSQHITPVFIGQFAARVWWNPLNPVLLGQDRGSHWSHVHRKKTTYHFWGNPSILYQQSKLKIQGIQGPPWHGRRQQPHRLPWAALQTWVCQKQCGICGEVNGI
jgi:hypothetical protein